MFKKLALLVLVFPLLAGSLFANDDTKLQSMIIGEWVFIAHRHELTVTYKKDGTFTSENESGSRKGTWKIQDGNLIEKSTTGTIESKIKFTSKNSFTLDDAFTYERM